MTFPRSRWTTDKMLKGNSNTMEMSRLNHARGLKPHFQARRKPVPPPLITSQEVE